MVSVIADQILHAPKAKRMLQRTDDGNVREQVSRLFGAYRRKLFPVYFRVNPCAPCFSSAQAFEAGPCTWGAGAERCRWLHIRDLH